VTAGEELHREVIEVLRATRNDRAASLPGAESALATCDDQLTQLGDLNSKLEGLRAALWTPSNGEVKDVPKPPAPALPNAPGGTA
jgi:hypothetical protein